MISLDINEHCWNLLVRAVLVLCVVPGFVIAPVTGAAAGTAQEPGEQTTQQKYDEIVGKWRDAAKIAAVAGGKFYVADRKEAADIEKRWREALDDGNRQMALLKPVAIQLFRETAVPGDDLVQLMIRFMEQDLVSGLYEPAFELSELLLSKNMTDSQILERIMTSRATLSIFTNRFELAKDIEINHGYVIEDLPLRAKSLFLSHIDGLNEKYANEVETRKQEKESDDQVRWR